MKHRGLMSHQDIARRLGLSKGTIQNIEKRALEKLRRIDFEDEVEKKPNWNELIELGR